MKQRIVETNEGIQGEMDTAEYDGFMREMRDRGWMATDQIIDSGIRGGETLEVGPGPGYLGLEWLKKCAQASLTGIEISPNMIRIAQKNAGEYGLSGRVCYVEGNAMTMPFPQDRFDGVFSNGSLHEWEEPLRVFAEICRVLKPDGRFFVSDLKRDISLPVRTMMSMGSKSDEMKKGLESSINAAYTAKELQKMLFNAAFSQVTVKSHKFGLYVYGQK